MLGCISDIEIDTDNASVVAIVIRGRQRFFGLFGREDDIVIPWCEIEIIGEDTVLIGGNPPPPRRRGRLGRLLGDDKFEKY
jgi:YlmC/YmxH family sporulation protein